MHWPFYLHLTATILLSFSVRVTFFLWNVHSVFFSVVVVKWIHRRVARSLIYLEDLFVFKSVGNTYFFFFFLVSIHFCSGISVRSLWNAVMSFLSPLSFCNRKHSIVLILKMGFVESSKKSFFPVRENEIVAEIHKHKHGLYINKWDFAFVSNRILIGFKSNALDFQMPIDRHIHLQ